MWESFLLWSLTAGRPNLSAMGARVSCLSSYPLCICIGFVSPTPAHSSVLVLTQTNLDPWTLRRRKIHFLLQIVLAKPSAFALVFVGVEVGVGVGEGDPLWYCLEGELLVSWWKVR